MRKLMVPYIRRIILVIICGLFSGSCAGTVGQVAGLAAAGNAKVEAIVDRGIARVGVVADEYLEALDIVEAAALHKLQRYRSARCLTTFPSMVRAIRKSADPDAVRARFLRDCGIEFPEFGIIVVRPKVDELE